MGDFEDKLRRQLLELGDAHTPDPDLPRTIAARTRQRARQRRVSAVSASVVAMLAVVGTAMALGYTSRYPQHSRVDGAVAGTTTPESGGTGGTSSGARHSKHSRTSATSGARGGSTDHGGVTGHAPTSDNGSGPGTPGSGGAGAPLTGTNDTSPTSTPPPSDTTATPDTTATTGDTSASSAPPVTDTMPTAPTIAITGPRCPPPGTSTFTAVVTGAATVTWSNGQSGAQAQYAFAAPGTVTISATATDTAGRSSSASDTVAVGATC